MVLAPRSTKLATMTASPRRTIEDATEELVRFFRALPPADRREYEALAALDRTFGEDVLAEQRERARGKQS